MNYWIEMRQSHISSKFYLQKKILFRFIFRSVTTTILIKNQIFSIKYKNCHNFSQLLFFLNGFHGLQNCYSSFSQSQVSNLSFLHTTVHFRVNFSSCKPNQFTLSETHLENHPEHQDTYTCINLAYVIITSYVGSGCDKDSLPGERNLETTGGGGTGKGSLRLGGDPELLASDALRLPTGVKAREGKWKFELFWLT